MNPDAAAPTPPRLAACAVSFVYPGQASDFRIDDWSHDFHSGTITALTGASGCGKSTRLYLLGLMVRLGAGAVKLDGQQVDQLPDAQRSALRAQRFGFVFQDAALDATRTVLDNICETALYRGQSRAESVSRAHELMRQFKVDVPANRRPGQISGGQAQRIALCRAILHAPDVLLADEPTGNLDSQTGREVLAALRAHADAGGCVVLVTHDQNVAAAADHVLEVVKQ